MLLRNAFLIGLWSGSLLVESLPHVQVLVAFSHGRVQQLLVPSRSPTFLLLEVLTVFSQDRFQRRLLDLITWMSTCPTLPSGCSFSTPPRASPITGTEAPRRLPGSHLPASGSSGLVRGLRGDGSGSGTGAPVSAHMTSLRCLLSEAWHPLTPFRVPLLAVLFGVHVLLEKYRLGFFWVSSVLCALLGSTAETVHVSVFGGFWLLFHTYPCQGGRRILRGIG